MRKLTRLLGLPSDEDMFRQITRSFRNTLTTWDYYVDWKKVFANVAPFEIELNLLNCLIGKQDILSETTSLVRQYPEVIRAIPLLLGCRKKNFDILIDTRQLLDKKYDFTVSAPTEEQARNIAEFVCSSGLGELFHDKKVKNLVDYVTGVEVGLDSNGRKNRGGFLMEDVVCLYLESKKKDYKFDYIKQATAESIKAAWNWPVEMDRSDRRIDFAIKTQQNLYLVEVNFYSASGSKLKSTAGEYCEMYERYRDQGYDFIWITDGEGWHSSWKPLEEYFRKTDYLLNLEMLKQGVLLKIIQ